MSLKRYEIVFENSKLFTLRRLKLKADASNVKLGNESNKVSNYPSAHQAEMRQVWTYGIIQSKNPKRRNHDRFHH